MNRTRVIDADALKRKAQKVATEAWKMKVKANVETVLNQFIDWIDDAQAIEPERKTGKWIDGKLDWHGIAMERYCSECGQLLTSAKTVYMNYCPNCGADMRGEQDGSD